MATLSEAYEDQVKGSISEADVMRRVAELRGPIGGVRPPLPGTLGVPTTPPAQRIAELAQQIAEAGHALQIARAQFAAAQEARLMADKAFIEVSERLMQAIHEHREGTPEGVPYPS